MAAKNSPSETAVLADDESDIIEDLDAAIAELDPDNQLVDYAPRGSDLLGSFSVACLFLNRTLGSGIYASPAFVLAGTRSIGISLVLWMLGALVALCSLLVWLEFGLSIPRQPDSTGNLQNAPRSGGEKNYLEYVFRRPRLLATCTYGIMFLVLGNLAGNAVFIGQFTMLAVRGRYPEEDGLGPADGSVIGIAIAALTLSVLLHVFSRRGGILLNNIFAVVKVLLLVAVIILGFINLGYARSGNGKPQGWVSQPDGTIIDKNFDGPTSFAPKDHAADGPSVIGAFLYITYAYSGY